MKANGLRSFEEILDTLIERDEISKKECVVKSVSGKTKINTSAIFYKLREKQN